MVDEGERSIEVADDRELRVAIAGDTSGRPIFVHYGTPNSRHFFAPNVDDARERGAYLVSWDRPGYGGSTPQPGRTVADVATDARKVAEALGVDSVVTWGISGGGPHALACAALLPDLVVATATLGSIAPFDAEGLDYFDGMGELNVEDFKLYAADKDAARKKTHDDWEEFRSADGEQVKEAMTSLLSPVDREAVTGDLLEWMMATIRDGIGESDEGWWEDGVAHLEGWGFDVDSIDLPVKVFHGRHDRFVPVGHGEWLADHIPGAERDISSADGHLTLLQRIGDVHEWLFAQS
jgi:pimeloyl-ACP methyl ester carboxylesterase